MVFQSSVIPILGLAVCLYSLLILHIRQTEPVVSHFEECLGHFSSCLTPFYFSQPSVVPIFCYPQAGHHPLSSSPLLYSCSQNGPHNYHVHLNMGYSNPWSHHPHFSSRRLPDFSHQQMCVWDVCVCVYVGAWWRAGKASWDPANHTAGRLLTPLKHKACSCAPLCVGLIFIVCLFQSRLVSHFQKCHHINPTRNSSFLLCRWGKRLRGLSDLPNIT